MSRIYQSEGAQRRYQAQDRDTRFNPVVAQSDDRAIKEWTAARIEDAKTLGRDLARSQARENMALQAQQSLERSNQSIRNLGERGDLVLSQLRESNLLQLNNQAKANQLNLGLAAMQANHRLDNMALENTSRTLQAVLALSSSALNTYGEIKQRQEKEQEKQQAIDGILGILESDTPKAPELPSAAVRAEAQAVNNAAGNLEKSGNPLDVSAATRLYESSAWQQLGDLRGNVYAAKSMWPVVLAEAVASGAIQGGSTGMSQGRELLRKFVEAAGLVGADRELLADFVAGAYAAVGNAVVGTTHSEATAAKEARMELVRARTSDLADGAGAADIGAAFDMAREEYRLGGVGIAPTDRLGATSTALKEFLANLEQEGDSEKIAALREHVYNPATGRTLGQDFDHLFDQAERRARAGALENYRLDQAERELATKQAIQFFYDDPSPENRQAAIAELRKIGTEDALKEAERLAEHGLTYDPRKKFELLELQQRGVEIPEDTLRQLLTDGTISAEEYKQFSRTGPQKQAAKLVDDYIKSQSASLKTAMMGQAGAQDLTAEVKAELNTRHQMFMEELQQLVAAEVAVKGGAALAGDAAELTRIVEAKTKYLLAQPHYKLQGDMNNGWKFAGEIKADPRLARITVAPGVQDFSKYTPEQVFGQIKFPRSEMNAGKDRFLTKAELEADVMAVLEGRSASNKTRLWARNLGLSSQAFVESQLRVYGKPSLNTLRQGTEAMQLLNGLRDVPDAKKGMNLLKSMGFPTKGAAYIAGNIQQESGWHGLRDWGEVAGDGTSRNGGLVSWAQWHNSPGRLGMIERKFGTTIDKIPESAQLQYMVEEMRKSYPRAYAIFTNPNATDAQLRWASSHYWGYGHEGARFKYAANLISTGSL